MKTFNIFKVICCVGLILLASESFLKTGEDSVEKEILVEEKDNNKPLCFCSDEDIVNDALTNMHSLFESGGGRPTKASSTYELTENTPIRCTTKVYYTTTYHKKPLSSPKEYQQGKLTANRTVKVTFKKNDKTVELFEKGSRGKRRVEVAIPSILQT